VYQARKCTSEFRQGKFEQTIEGSLYNFPVPQQQNTATAQSASVSADTSGAAERAGNPENAQRASDTLTLPGTGALPAPPAIDTVQLSATSAASTLASVNLIRQGSEPTTSNGSAVQTVNLPAPQALNAQTTVTNTPSQQMSGEE
jgi:hypothetical protein